MIRINEEELFFYQDIKNEIDEEDYMFDEGDRYLSGILFDKYPNGQIKYEKIIIEGVFHFL